MITVIDSIIDKTEQPIQESDIAFDEILSKQLYTQESSNDTLLDEYNTAYKSLKHKESFTSESDIAVIDKVLQLIPHATFEGEVLKNTKEYLLKMFRKLKELAKKLWGLMLTRLLLTDVDRKVLLKKVKSISSSFKIPITITAKECKERYPDLMKPFSYAMRLQQVLRKTNIIPQLYDKEIIEFAKDPLNIIKDESKSLSSRMSHVFVRTIQNTSPTKYLTDSNGYATLYKSMQYKAFHITDNGIKLVGIAKSDDYIKRVFNFNENAIQLTREEITTKDILKPFNKLNVSRERMKEVMNKYFDTVATIEKEDVEESKLKELLDVTRLFKDEVDNIFYLTMATTKDAKRFVKTYESLKEQ